MSTPERPDFDVVESDGRYILNRTGSDAPRPSYSVIEAVSDVTDRGPDALQPLYDVIDPDALDALFSQDDSRTQPSSKGHLRFRYEGVVVTVYAGGRIVVSDPNVEDT